MSERFNISNSALQDRIWQTKERQQQINSGFRQPNLEKIKISLGRLQSSSSTAEGQHETKNIIGDTDCSTRIGGLFAARLKSALMTVTLNTILTLITPPLEAFEVEHILDAFREKKHSLESLTVRKR